MLASLDETLEGLKKLGCKVERVDRTLLVSLPDGFAEFVFEQLGGWLYLGTTFLTPDELDESAFPERLDHFLLILQNRNLGCRFSYDVGGFLSIGTELNPDQQTPEEILENMEQIAFVIESCLPLCDHVLETAEIPSDKEVDQAFGISDSLH